MREILFRGKRCDNGEWLEGWYQPPVSGTHIDGRKENLGASIAFVDYDGFLEDAFIIPETVGQFTGLTDKNGKKIFEGDIVLYPWNEQDKPERFTIKFKDGQFVASPVKETEDYWDFMVGGYSKEMEIIGNIHDNPELLEVSE